MFLLPFPSWLSCLLFSVAVVSYSAFIFNLIVLILSTVRINGCEGHCPDGLPGADGPPGTNGSYGTNGTNGVGPTITIANTSFGPVGPEVINVGSDTDLVLEVVLPFTSLPITNGISTGETTVNATYQPLECLTATPGTYLFTFQGSFQNYGSPPNSAYQIYLVVVDQFQGTLSVRTVGSQDPERNSPGAVQYSALFINVVYTTLVPSSQICAGWFAVGGGGLVGFNVADQEIAALLVSAP
jgi:hypothetical protein